MITKHEPRFLAKDIVYELACDAITNFILRLLSEQLYSYNSIVKALMTNSTSLFLKQKEILPNNNY